MVEESGFKESLKKPNVEFVDDLNFFEKTLNVILNEIDGGIYNENSIKIGNLEIFFSDDRVDSMYYFDALG
jgi:hypothetical protein